MLKKIQAYQTYGGVSIPKVESLLLLRYTYALSGWDNTRLPLTLSGSSNDLVYP